MDTTTDRLKNIDQQEFKFRKQQVFEFLDNLEYKDLPQIIRFTYDGYTFDLTEEYYQTLI